MTEIATKIKDNASAPASVKTQFESLNKEFDAVRKKFGVPIPLPNAGGRGGGGGGGRGGGADPENVLARAGATKTSILAFWESPSPALLKQYGDVKLALPKAIAEANAVLAKAKTVSAAIKPYDLTLTVPPVGK